MIITRDGRRLSVSGPSIPFDGELSIDNVGEIEAARAAVRGGRTVSIAPEALDAFRAHYFADIADAAEARQAAFLGVRPTAVAARVAEHGIVKEALELYEKGQLTGAQMDAARTMVVAKIGVSPKPGGGRTETFEEELAAIKAATEATAFSMARHRKLRGDAERAILGATTINAMEAALATFRSTDLAAVPLDEEPAA